MSTQVFYRKWRPQTLEELVGQEHVTRTLKRALETGRIAHAYLFCGPRGTGKTSTGRILAKAVNCLTNGGKGEPCNTCLVCQEVTEGKSLDVIEIDAASNRGIDNIRELREKAGYSPAGARYKIYIVDEVHQLTGPAFGALLKTLEEPPPHIIFILATTEPHMVPATILSRCQRFDFRRLGQPAVMDRLSHICRHEGIEIDAESLRLINRASTGSLRDAENILEQMVASFGQKIELEQVRQTLGLSGEGRIRELAGYVMNRSIAPGLNNINQAARDGLDLRQYNRELVNYLRALLFVKGGAAESVEATPEEVQEMQKLVAGVSMNHVLKAAQTFGAIDVKLDSYSPLPLELALLECSLETRETPHPVRAATERPPAPVRKPAGAPPPPAKVAAPVSLTEPPPQSYRAAPEREVPPVPQAAPEAPAPPQPVTNLEQLKTQWRNILLSASLELRKSPAAALLRGACRPVAMENDTITLAFKFDIHKKQLEKDGNRQTAEKLLSEYIGRPCKVECIVQTEKDMPMVKAAEKLGARIMNAENK
ncbi:MAG: DNA polymerase III subunit gamma/tau [Chloroflexi bacterium]|nr:DNA polymerase III subunit gamma/tau [Chloroflexota bacterium]